MFIYLFVYSFVYFFVYLFVYLFTHSFTSLFTCLFVCLFVYLFTCLLVYLFTCLLVYLFTCLLVYSCIGDRRHSLGKQQTKAKTMYTRSEVVFLSDKEHKAKTSSLKLKTADSGDEGDTEDKQILLRPKLKTCISIRKHKRTSDRQSREYSPKQNIIRKMLSSPFNLLNMCLKLGNFVSAYEVVKIFKLEGQIGAQMVHFAEKIEYIGIEMASVSKQDEVSAKTFPYLKSLYSGTCLIRHLYNPGLSRAYLSQFRTSIISISYPNESLIRQVPIYTYELTEYVIHLLLSHLCLGS